MCEFEACDREAYARGLCRGHYSQRRRGAPLTPLRKRRTLTIPASDLPCSFDDCELNGYAKGLCRAHYGQQARGTPLTPIGTRGRTSKRKPDDAGARLPLPTPEAVRPQRKVPVQTDEQYVRGKVQDMRKLFEDL